MSGELTHATVPPAGVTIVTNDRGIAALEVLLLWWLNGHLALGLEAAAEAALFARGLCGRALAVDSGHDGHRGRSCGCQCGGDGSLCSCGCGLARGGYKYVKWWTAIGARTSAMVRRGRLQTATANKVQCICLPEVV